jgi:hypothetical protein
MTEPETSIRYYNWEGHACRVYKHANGNTTADIYRGGQGVLPVEPTDVEFEATPISEKAYQELVLEEIDLHKRKGQGS